MRAAAAGLVFLSPASLACDETWDRAEDAQGFLYKGCQNVTAPTAAFPEGIACQPWNTQVPHEHPFDPRVADNLFIPGNVDIGFHNYCRNPTGASGGIYCFTMDPAVRFAYCCPLDDLGCPVPGPATPRPTPKPTVPGVKYNFEGESEPTPACGDGFFENPNKDGRFEDCDDGNLVDADGCTNCSIDEGFVCELDQAQKSLCAMPRDNTFVYMVQFLSLVAGCFLIPLLYNMFLEWKKHKVEKPREGEAIVQMPDGSYRKVNMMACILKIQTTIRKQRKRREAEKRAAGLSSVVPEEEEEPGVSAGPAKDHV